MSSVIKKISFFFFLFFSFDVFIFSKTVSEQKLDLYIYKPEIQGISEENEWILDFIQNVVYEEVKQNYNIEVYSLDKNVEDDVIEETDSLFESENVEDFVQKDNEKSKIKDKSYDLVINGNYKNSYNFNFQIIEKNSKQTFAIKKISGCSFSELETGKVLQGAILSLFSDLKIKPLETGNNSKNIADEDFKASMEAQQLLAKGLYAQRHGLSVEAMDFFIRAKMKDSTLSKLSKVMNTVSNSISAGDLGEQSRNLINYRKAFIKLLDETEAYFEQNIPYVIVYSPDLTLGKIDYEKEKAKYLFKSAVALKYDAKEIYENIVLLYNSQPDSVNWNLSERINGLLKKEGFLYVQYELYDKNKKRLAVTRNKIAINKKDVFLNEYSFNVPAKCDTKQLIFSISQTKFSNKNYKVSDKRWWASEIGNVDVEKYQIKEFEEKYIYPRCQLDESDVRALSYLTLPKSVDLNNTSKLLGYFGDNLQEVCDYYFPYFSSRDEIVLTSSEEKIVGSYQIGKDLKKRNIVSTKIYVSDSSVPWHRKKTEFRKHIKDYNFFEVEIKNDLNALLFISYDNYGLLKSAEIKENEFFYETKVDVGYWKEYKEWDSYLEEYVKRTKWVSTGTLTKKAITKELGDILKLGPVNLYCKTTENDSYIYKFNEKENKKYFLNSTFMVQNYLENLLFEKAEVYNNDLYMTEPANEIAISVLQKLSMHFYHKNIPVDKGEIAKDTYSYINQVLRRTLKGNISLYIVSDRELKKLNKSASGKDLADKIKKDSNFLYFYRTENPPLQYNQRKRFDLKMGFPQFSYTAPYYCSVGFGLVEFDFPIGKHLYGGVECGHKFIKDLNTGFWGVFDSSSTAFYGFAKIGLNFNLHKYVMFSTYVDAGYFDGRSVGTGIEFITNKNRFHNFFMDYNLGYTFNNKLTDSGMFYDRFSMGYVLTLDLTLKK